MFEDSEVEILKMLRWELDDINANIIVMRELSILDSWKHYEDKGYYTLGLVV